MQIVDIIIGGLILYGTVKGFKKGLLSEVASLLALFLGILGAARLNTPVSKLIRQHVDWSESAVAVVSFIAIFISIVIIVSLAGKALTKLAKAIALGLLNRILGAMFGGIKVVLLLSVLLLVFEKVNKSISLFPSTQFNNTILYEPIAELVPKIAAKMNTNGFPSLESYPGTHILDPIDPVNESQ